MKNWAQAQAVGGGVVWLQELQHDLQDVPGLVSPHAVPGLRVPAPGARRGLRPRHHAPAQVVGLVPGRDVASPGVGRLVSEESIMYMLWKCSGPPHRQSRGWLQKPPVSRHKIEMENTSDDEEYEGNCRPPHFHLEQSALFIYLMWRTMDGGHKNCLESRQVFLFLSWSH